MIHQTKTMVHNPDPHFVSIVGMGVGFLSICIAIYLQSIATGRCPISYILGYTIIGSSMVLMHINPIARESTPVLWVKILLYLAMIAVLIWSGWRAKSSMDLDSPIQEVEESLGLKGD